MTALSIHRGAGALNPGRIILLALALGACAAPSTPHGRWIGAVTPAAPSALCKPSRGVALLRDGEVTFTPDEGTWILLGTATKDGAIEASRDQPGSGRNRQPWATSLDARWTEAAVTGTYTTPRCTYSVALTRQ